MDVFDLDLRLLARLDPIVEPGRPLRGEDAVGAAVQDAEAQGRVARRLARAVEAEVLLAITGAHVRPAFAQDRAQLGVIVGPGKAKLELGFDRSVSLRPRHEPREYLLCRAQAAVLRIL